MAAGADYDALRVRDDPDTADTYLEQLAARRNDPSSGTIDVDDAGTAEPQTYADEPFGVTDEPVMPVRPQQADEFVCSRCFLVLHRRRLARTLRSKPICRDCS